MIARDLNSIELLMFLKNKLMINTKIKNNNKLFSVF